VNVTIPHKGVALAVADSATEAARAIGAANTLTYDPDGSIAADNTDAPGLMATLEGRPRRTAVVLGAGGSARAIVWALVNAGCEVVLWNRTHARAQELTDSLGGSALKLDPENAVVPEADVLVNCTAAELDDSSIGLTGLPLTVDQLARYATVVDLAYKPGGTVLTAEAAKRTFVVDGLEILVQQGARSFELWTGRPADVEVMRSAVRNKEDHGAAYDPPGGRPVP
jgi:shikimate dehydrogenase